MNTSSSQQVVGKLSTQTNSYRCRACNTIWIEDQVQKHIVGRTSVIGCKPIYICGDAFCQGTCDLEETK